MKALTIGQVAKAAGVGVETVRFYERQRLVHEPPRRASGYRQYPEDVVQRIRFIKRAKALGFSLKEVAELLALRVDRHVTKGTIKQRVHAKLAEIDRKLADLQRMRRSLTKLAEACSGHGSAGSCPILEAMDAEQAGP